MATRPFHVNVSIDGRNTDICGGPKSKTGGQQIILRQRRNGESVIAFTILSFSYPGKDGKLKLVTKILDSDNKKVAECETDY